MRRPLLLMLVLGALLFVPLRGARADTTTASTTEEGWYRTPPTCVLPVGCGPTDSLPPVSQYPAGTLHVGVFAGTEEARTYLKLDLGVIPAGGRVRGGTLTLAVAPAADGTASPETAQMLACWVNAPFAAAEGSLATPPSIDCANAPLVTYVAGPPAVFTIDLANFASRWAAGETNDGIAVVPVPGQGPGATWHVAFSARTRAGSDVPPARATLEYEPPQASEPEVAPPIVDEPSFDEFEVEVPFTESPLLALSPPPASPAAPILAETRAPDSFTPVFAEGGPGFAYPIVMVAPLVLLALGGYLAWALTQPVAQADS